MYERTVVYSVPKANFPKMKKVVRSQLQKYLFDFYVN